jgi:two-component system response regulator DesR
MFYGGRSDIKKHIQIYRELEMIKIVLVDDEPSVRTGLRMCLELELDLTVVGEAENGVEAIELAQTLKPDVLVVDVEMPGLDGITATARLREVMPDVSVVMLSLHADPNTRARAQAAGAVAFVEKQGLVDQLLDAIRRTAHGA